MSDFENWRSFNSGASTVQLWVFKKSTTDARFRSWHVPTDADVESLFRQAFRNEVARITENIAYGHLAQNNEASCLVHPLEESASLVSLLALVDRPEIEHKIKGESDLKGAAGYVVKFQHDGSTVYAIRKTAPTWKTSVRRSLMNVIFRDGELSALAEESFSFDSKFDFYCMNSSVLISSKTAYESSMSEKKVYVENFKQLTMSTSFAALFVDIEPLRKFVGTNAMQLRRMSAIEEKAIYSGPNFLVKLKAVNGARNWGLNFNASGQIIACEHTARIIMQVLLDHRLLSEITDAIYDVPDATQVA